MPSVGIPSSKMPRSTRGAFSAYTDAGPPERITAYGLRRRISSGVTRCPTSSEYTRASRTRRAISCAYCPPRSRTSTGRSSGAGSGTGSRTTSAPIVGRLLRDRHVVRMRLAQPRGGDAHELGLLQLRKRRRAAVAHRLPQPADELIEDVPHRALVRDAPLDALGDHPVDVLDVALEVAVLREPARLHRADRAHAAVLLEALALVHHDVAGALLRTCEERAEHRGIRAGRERLRQIAGRRHSAVCDQRHACARAPASASASARSTASGPTPTAAATRKRPCESFVAVG